MTIAEKYAAQWMPNGEVSLADLIQAAVDEAQSVPVVGEVVAWVRRHPDGALTAEFLEDAVIEPVRRNSGGWLPLIAKPTHSIHAAELATLREKAAERDELRKDAARYQFIRALENDAVAIQLVKSECDVDLDDAIDAAIAQGKGE